MWVLLNNWVSAIMELPGLLAPIPNGAAACVFWMSLCFYQYFQAARMQLGQGLPPIPCMAKLMEQLQLHVFAQMALPLPAHYLPAGCPRQPGPRATNDDNPNWGMRVQNPHPNTAFCAYDKAGQLGPAITKHLAPITKGQPMCLLYHLQNTCNSDCPRATSHHTHSAAKDNLILAWAKIAFAPA